MTEHAAVPLDTAKEIHELDERGYGRNTISRMTGINSSTVRNVLDGTHQKFDNTLTVRQRQNMMLRAFCDR